MKRNLLRLLYIELSVIGFVWPLVHLGLGFKSAGVVPTMTDVFGMFANPGLATISSDLIIVATAAALWMFVEAKRLNMRWWLYALLTVTTPFAFVVPFFLWQRELTLSKAAAP